MCNKRVLGLGLGLGLRGMYMCNKSDRGSKR